MNCPRLLAAFALCATTSAAFGADSELDALKHAYDNASKITGFGQPLSLSAFEIGDSPDAPRALEEQWSLATQWLCKSLPGQSALDEKRVSGILHNLDSALDVELLALKPDAYLIAIKRGEIGTIFLLRKSGKQFESDWNIRQTTSLEIYLFPELAAWRASATSEICKTKQGDFGGRCGPLFGYFGPLPNDGTGRSRFYVVGQYAAAGGATVGRQLSFWAWGNDRIIPIYEKSYFQVLEVSSVPTFRGNILHVPTKEQFASFFSCGDCLGRQADWSIRVEPENIEDLGTKSEMPELDAVDSFVDRIAHRRPTADIAAPNVAAKITAVVGDAKADLASYPNADRSYFSLGMLMDGEVELDPSAPRQSLLCFSTDNLPDHLLFTLLPRQKGFFISNVRNLGSLDTPDKLCSRRAIY
jgi:hypothetical protein